MTDLHTMLPEILLLVAAAVLFILGATPTSSARRAAPVVALVAMIVAFFSALISNQMNGPIDGALGHYVKAIATGVGALLVLLAWPTSADGSDNPSISYGTETGEFFALLLLAIGGMCIVSTANALPTLFLGIELASIPTYIMVTMSRPHELAQEAGVKYFFLGAAAAALMLLGMSYLFGATGEIQLDKIATAIAPHAGENGPGSNPMPTLALLGVVILIIGFCFKLAAVPMHFYAGDVYQGAATPVTAAISFIPKVSGTIALLKILQVAGGGEWMMDPRLINLIWIIAVLTMTVGNVLALWQYNVKRVLAYSSVAHSGYILVGVAALASAHDPAARQQALGAVLFYLAAYGIMNTATFGVMMLLPSRTHGVTPRPATTAETYEDLAGAGRLHPLLGLAMTASCLSLIGIPSTVGFFGKFYLLRPAITSGQPALVWLAIITMVNAAISTGYYLKIISTFWSPAEDSAAAPASPRSPAVVAAITMSVAATLALGIILPLTTSLFAYSSSAGAALMPR